MRSMTGYAESKIKTDNFIIEIILQSVNCKQLNIRMNLQEELYFCEMNLRKIMRNKLNRGAVFLKLNLVYLDEKKMVCLDEKKAEFYIKQAQKLQTNFKNIGQITISDLLAIEGIFINSLSKLNRADLEKYIVITLKQGLDELNEVQNQEGQEIIKDLFSHYQFLKNYLKKIKSVASNLVNFYDKRLLEKLKKLEGKIDLDKNTLAKELIIFSDRYDITEEIVRLNIHLNYFQQLLKEKNDNGRELDFLIQEIMREINTIGSKVQESNISNLVIKFKTELEKCREQIQNLA